MKKLIAILLMLTVLFLLPACADSDSNSNSEKDNHSNQTEKLTAEEIYAKAEKNMNELKSITSNTVMDMNMDLGGLQFKTTVSTTTYLDDEANKVYAITTTSDGTTSSEIKLYYDSSVYMMETEDVKMMADLSADDFNDLQNQDTASVQLALSDFASYEMTENDNGYTFTITGLKSESALDSLLGEATESLEGASIDLSDVELTIQINKAYEYTSIDMKFTMNMDLSELEFGTVSANISAKITYSDLNSSADKIVKPSEDGYVKVELSDLLGE